MELDTECFAILDDPSLFEEDKVDKIEEVVTRRFPAMASHQVERTIMDIMWRHEDPKRALTQLPRVVKVEEREMGIDIPGFERRVQLQQQYAELQAMEEQAKKKNYNDLKQKTDQLSRELYGEQSAAVTRTAPPIDQLSELFNHTVTKARIHQALKSVGYNVVDAANLILLQLKRETRKTDALEEPFFGAGKNLNIVCSYFAKNGKCFKADCQFRHDTDNRTCSFWLKGRCLAGADCLFKHSLGDLPSMLTPPPTSTSTSTSTPVAMTTTTTTTTTITTDSKPKFSMDSPSFTSKAIPIRLPLRKPKFIPWDSDDPRFETYNHHRRNAAKAEDLRKKFAKTSTEAWRTNNGLKSKQFSTKAAQQEEKFFDALKLADDELAKYSDSVDDEVWFEMHGLDFNNAVEQLESSLQEVRNSSAKGSKTVFAVAPSTFDYAQYKKTTKPITIWLDHEGYRWELHSCGNGNMGSIVAIDPWSR